MEASLLSDLFELKELINSSKWYLDVKRYESLMLSDKDCLKLLSSYQTLISDYQEKLKLKLDAKELIKRISDFQLEMNKNIIIKSYQESFKLANDTLNKISHQIFNNIVSDLIIGLENKLI